MMHSLRILSCNSGGRESIWRWSLLKSFTCQAWLFAIASLPLRVRVPQTRYHGLHTAIVFITHLNHKVMLVFYKRLKLQVVYSSAYPICHIFIFDLILFLVPFHQGEEFKCWFFVGFLFILGECFEDSIHSWLQEWETAVLIQKEFI